MTTLKNLKFWGGNEEIIFQIEDETFRIIDAREIEVFWGETSKKPKFFDEVDVSIFEVFANPNCNALYVYWKTNQ